MIDNRPIGVFDSGVGGLTVWRQMVKLLPHESTIYVADGANCPYGPKDPQTIVSLSTEITRFLLAQQCKMIVVACNTASAAALWALRAQFSVPFVGMEPAVKPAARATRTGHIGVLATEGTLQGDLFNHTTQQYARDVIVHRQVAHGLVALVEAGEFSGRRTENLLRHYLRPMQAEGIDQLVLGCTHYPFLIPAIERVVGKTVSIIDPAEAVARQVQRILTQLEQAAAANSVPQHRFFSTGTPDTLQRILAKIDAPPCTVESLAWCDGRLSQSP